MQKIPHSMEQLRYAKNMRQLISWGYENILFEKTQSEALYGHAHAEKFLGYYHSFAPHAFLRKRYYENRLRDALALAIGKRVLVVGSGLGSEVFLLRASGAREVVGIDIDADFIRQSEARIKTWEAQGVSFVEDGIMTYQTSQMFDLIFVMETYHHIVPKENFFPVLHRLLRPKGFVVVCEPNGENPFVVHSMKKRGYMTGEVVKIGHHLATDEMFVPAPVITKQLSDASFVVGEIKRYRVFPGVPFAWADFLLSKIEPLVERVVPLRWIGVGYTIVAKKISG